MEKRAGKFLLRTHIGETGLYGGVELEVETTEAAQLSVEVLFSDNDLPGVIKSSIAFGCYNAFENMAMVNSGRHKIVITEVFWHNIDSCTALIAFAAGKAVQNAFMRDDMTYPKIEKRQIVFNHGFSFIEM